jgi:hypothetical protein
VSSPSDLFGSGNSGLSLSTDYGTGQFNGNLSSSQNVRPISSPEVNPMYKGNYGRKAALMGNWRNPISGQGTFFPQDDGSGIEPPKPDSGESFRERMQDGG